ncbi:terminase [Escherichia coli]|nr:terminase [Escherichia coli]EFO2512314.1 terminase [Escherichia coli]EFO2543805.1 terminase [Escherichia coli]EFO2569856.1 terminase [Escherichia coli]EFO2591344.1 terminase [Escherichia coli]
MSRPDWGALQQEYIAEYTRSGISPVAWCEARGLNYATARRYIKKTPKNAQKEMRRKKCAKLRKKVREKKLRRLRKGRTENLRKKRLYPMHS